MPMSIILWLIYSFITSTLSQDLVTCDEASSFKVLSIDHGSDTTGKYFNFHIDKIDGVLGRDDWTAQNFNVYIERTSQVKQVILWRNNNGGSIGDAHGRIDDGTAKDGDFQIGDKITFIGITLNCQPSPCNLKVLSVDHEWSDGQMGKYFNFDMSVVDRILRRNDWSTEKFLIYNSRTRSINKVIIWRESQYGSIGDGQGREDDSTAKEGDFQAGDSISFVGIPSFCHPAKCPLKVLSVDHEWVDGLFGKYFNYHKSVIDGLLGREDWSRQNFLIYNSRTGLVNKVIMWRDSIFGSLGDGQGRKDDGTAKSGDFEIGDWLSFVGVSVNCQSSPCIFDVLSVDHEWVEGVEGKYFSFDKDVVDVIMGTNDWSSKNFLIYNSRTESINNMIIWRDSTYGSIGDGQGRKDDGTSQEGDFHVGDKLSFVGVNVFCQSSICPLEVLSVDHEWFEGIAGKYFSFNREIVDGILRRDDWSEENFIIYNSRTYHVSKVKMWRNSYGSMGDGQGREDDGTATAGDFEVGDQISVFNTEQRYLECLRVDIEDNIGSITVNDDGTIEQNNDGGNNADLFCGTNDDKPLWTALLSLNQDLLNSLITLKGEDSLQGIFEYIQCSEFVYYAVMRASVPGPTQTLELTNRILDLMQNIPGVGDIIGDSVDEISKFIVKLLDGLTPDDIGLQWSDYYEPNGKIFNPFEQLEPLAQFLSAEVCDVLVTGEDLNTMLINLRDSDSINELKQSFNDNIYGFLTDDSNILFDDSLKSELLTNDFYKEFTFVMTVGMQICFSKGMNGCVTRMHGVALNLKGESKIIDSRSMYVEFPTLEYGVSSSGFVHFDFMSSLDSIIENSLSLTVGVSTKTPGSETLNNYKSQWESHSDRATRIPFIGDPSSITVDFVNGKLDDNSLVVDILTGGSNARLAVLYSINTDMNCNGFRIDLTVGDYDAFGGSILFGYEYRKEGTGSIKQNLQWIDGVDLPNYQDIMNIIVSISADTINIFPDAINSVNNFVQNLGEQILDQGINSVKNVLNKAIDVVEDIANVGIDVANIGIDGLNSVINGANTLVDGANSVANTANNAKDDIKNFYNGISNAVNDAKKECKKIDDNCIRFGECFNVPFIGEQCINFDVCVRDIIQLDGVCNTIFEVITNADNLLKNAIDKLPDIPTIPDIPNVGSIDSIEIANVKAKKDNLMMLDDNMDEKRDTGEKIIQNYKQLPNIVVEIPPILYVYCFLFAMAFFIMWIYFDRYCLKSTQYKKISSYADSDTDC